MLRLDKKSNFVFSLSTNDSIELFLGAALKEYVIKQEISVGSVQLFLIPIPYRLI